MGHPPRRSRLPELTRRPPAQRGLPPRRQHLNHSGCRRRAGPHQDTDKQAESDPPRYNLYPVRRIRKAAGTARPPSPPWRRPALTARDTGRAHSMEDLPTLHGAERFRFANRLAALDRGGRRPQPTALAACYPAMHPLPPSVIPIAVGHGGRAVASGWLTGRRVAVCPKRRCCAPSDRRCVAVAWKVQMPLPAVGGAVSL